MIWPKEISFDGLDAKVTGWCRAHFLGDPPIDAQFALDLIFKTLIDDKEHLKYLTAMPETTEQVNSLKLDAILWKYSRAYRKWVRKGLKDLERRKNEKVYK